MAQPDAMKVVLTALLPAFLLLSGAFAQPAAPAGSNYDAGFYLLDLNISDSSTYISGRVSLRFTITAETADTLTFDMGAVLTADSVKIDSKAVSFSHPGNLLVVILPASLALGETRVADIYYHGLGSKSGNISGIYNKVNTYGKRYTWTLSEPLWALNWFPCKQSLTDKADSVYVFLSTDSNLKAGSNGRLTASVPLPGNRVRYEWKSRYPIAFYLISFAVGPYRDYSFYAKGPYISDSILVQNYIYDDDTYFAQNKESIDRTGDFLSLYSRLFGPYPFAAEKYGHCLTPSGGGMEHQTMTTLVNFSYTLVCHELAHQWFGDYVTCSSWQDIWVNEGFASYAEYLAYQYLSSQSDADSWIIRTQNYVKTARDGSIYVPADLQTDEDRIFDYRLTYAKGAAIIHMIRQEVGNDSLFFETLRDFLITYRNGTASGADFRDLLAEKTGKSFDRFFDQWYYGEGYPTHEINWTHQHDTLYINSIQTGTAATPVFDVLLEFGVKVNGRDTVLTFRQDSGYKHWQAYLPGVVTQVTADPHHWLLMAVSGLTRTDLARSQSKFVMTPNPARDRITLRFAEPLQRYTLYISDLSGRIVHSEVSESSRKTVDISGIPKGIYFVVVEENHLIYATRLVKN